MRLASVRRHRPPAIRSFQRWLGDPAAAADLHTAAQQSGRGMGDRFLSMHRHPAATVILGAALWVGSFGAVLAQTPPPSRGENVQNRFETAEPPPDIRVGGYKISPSAATEARYDDNIFVDDRQREGDFILSAGVGARAQSDFVRHALDFYGNVEGSHYITNDSEDFWEGMIGTRGRIDMHRELQLQGDVWMRRLTDPRDSPDNVNGTEPSVYRVFHGSSTLYAGTTGPILSRVEGGVERVINDDVPGATGTIDTSDRDRDEFYGEGQIGYQYLGQQQIYVRARGNKRSYDRQFDNGGFQRDSTGVRAETGITLDLGGLFFADLSVGYQRQDFEDARFGSVGRPVFGVAALWNPTGLTSVTADVRYEFVESFNSPSPGYWLTSYGLGVAHELRRNLIAVGKLILLDRDYERLDRSDLVYGASAGLRYRIQPGLFVEGEYRYRQQDSNEANADYYRNVVFARVRRVF
jgi:hypothetical protein